MIGGCSPTFDRTQYPRHRVTFATGFLVARHEVTVSAYEACEAASPATCTPPSVVDADASGWGVSRSADGRGAHPQNGLTWDQAAAVCAWLGGRLPTEAEWESAVQGWGAPAFPWGARPAPT